MMRNIFIFLPMEVPFLYSLLLLHISYFHLILLVSYTKNMFFTYLGLLVMQFSYFAFCFPTLSYYCPVDNSKFIVFSFNS